MIRNDRFRLLVPRKAQIPAGTVIPPDASETACVGCGEAALMTALGRQMVEAGEAQPVCDVCLARDEKQRRRRHENN